jgi:hypothetical protein
MFGRYSRSNSEKGTVFSGYLSASWENQALSDATYIGSESITEVNGIELNPGVNLSVPVNLNGKNSFRMGVDYGFPVEKLQSNLNVELGGSYSRTPGIVNNDLNIATSPAITTGLSFSSSFSEKLDFTISSRPSLNFVENSLIPASNSCYVSVQSRFRLYWQFAESFVLRTELTNQFYDGLSEDFNQNFTLLNSSLGYKFLKNDQLEMNLSVFDALEQNNSISRTVSETTIDDLQTIVLQRYFMVSLIWNILDFGGEKANVPDRSFGPPGGGRPPGPPPGH